MTKVLLVEDDVLISDSLCDFLSREGFDVACVKGQLAAEEIISVNKFDLALVDISLEDGSGYGVCAYSKQKGIPVIFLTASGDENSIVAGLDMGADDYIPKPFRPRELVSRMKSVLRRCVPIKSLIEIENVSVDTDKATVYKNGAEVFLSALEYKILLLFIGNRGKVLTRNAILEEIWDIDGDFVNDNTLTVYIKRLREKIEDDAAEPRIIKTVRGIGYRID